MGHTVLETQTLPSSEKLSSVNGKDRWGLQLDLVHIIPLGTEDISLSLHPQQEASGVVFLLLL